MVVVVVVVSLVTEDRQRTSVGKGKVRFQGRQEQMQVRGRKAGQTKRTTERKDNQIRRKEDRDKSKKQEEFGNTEQRRIQGPLDSLALRMS